MHPYDQQFFVIAPIKNSDVSPVRQTFHASPEVIVVRSSLEGDLNEYTWQPCGFTPDMTCLIAPSLPAASIAWKIRSTAHLSCAYSLSCNSSNAVTPVASASFARGLSASLVNSSVSSGSTSLRRKSFPLLMRNGSANSRALLMISFVFISSQ